MPWSPLAPTGRLPLERPTTAGGNPADEGAGRWNTPFQRSPARESMFQSPSVPFHSAVRQPSLYIAPCTSGVPWVAHVAHGPGHWGRFCMQSFRAAGNTGPLFPSLFERGTELLCHVTQLMLSRISLETVDVVSGTFGTVGFGGYFLRLSMKTRGCFVIWGWGWYFRDVDCCMHTAVVTQPSVFLVLQEHTGMPSGVAVPISEPATTSVSVCLQSASKLIPLSKCSWCGWGGCVCQDHSPPPPLHPDDCRALPSRSMFLDLYAPATRNVHAVAAVARPVPPSQHTRRLAPPSAEGKGSR